MPVVKMIDHKAIFERAAGHPAEQETLVIVCGEKPAPGQIVNTNRTMGGVRKPGSFAITPSRRKEQYFV